MPEREIKIAADGIACLEEFQRASAVGRDLHRELVAMVVQEAVEADSDLLQIVQALRSFAFCLGFAQTRKKQRRQNGNDAHDQEQLQKGEPLTRRADRGLPA